MKMQKIGIVGCGNVGATIAYTVMQSRLFSEIVLIDKNEEKARSEVMDLSHCLSFVAPMSIYQGTYEKLHDAGIVVVAAGANQEDGEDRLSLAEKNAKIIGDIVPRIAAVNKECIILLVTNPVDILSYEAYRLSGFDSNRIIGSGTVLDSGRLKYLVGERLNVDHRNVHTFIIGEHGDSELAVWSSANISGIDLDDYLHVCGARMGDLYGMYESVVSSAYEIIRGKGATYYAIAQAALRIIRSIVRDENTILPVSALVSGQYGIDDVYLSVPCVVGKGGVKHILEIPLNDDENARLQKSAAQLRQLLDRLSFAVV
ncbi:MAG: L-lactate dehydrogenase [Clostridiales bacterium]|nr:L-lactate dehydrogenase [Clostridiales bacterium]